MSKTLTAIAQNQLTNSDIRIKFILTIDGIDRSNYLLNWDISYSQEFGSASATFTLNNDQGIFGEGGTAKIEVGDVVSFTEKFGGDTVQYAKFYGIVNQRSIEKSATTRTITLVCLDYISTLQFMDIDFDTDGTKVEVTDEVLVPNYLPSPNENLAQLFNFSRDNVAIDPRPILIIRNKNTSAEDPAYDGFEIYNDVGQLKLGFPINARYNYDVMAQSYYYYIKGLDVEDILEDILIEPDGYGNYLFGETTAQAVIDNHLTETFLNIEGTSTDYLLPNYTTSSITIYGQLASNVTAGDTSITLVSTEGLPDSGEASINGDTFTWTNIGSDGVSLEGIPSTGEYSLLEHKTNDYIKYTADYAAGRVWYLKYNNLITNLTSSDFTIPGGTFSYIDKKQGRIILTAAITTTSIVRCNTNYSFKTLQATGIILNYISFRSRELENRLEAINKLRKYLAPNYIIRTIGDSKIWASYLSQKTAEDYTLESATGINYLEDEDLYTRVIFYGKNKNPTNLMFSDGIDFITSGNAYKSIATNIEMVRLRDEDNYYIYGPFIGGQITSGGDYTLTKWSNNIVTSSDYGTIDWTNPNYANFDDNDFATATGTGNTYYLKISGFNFGLPTDAVIKGVMVGIKRKATGTVIDSRVSLVVNGIVGTTNKSTTTSWTTTSQYAYYGASDTTWGETLTPAIVNASNFGVVISAQLSASTAYIDIITVAIIYSSATTAQPSSNQGIGKITANSIKPIVYVNGVAIDNTSHLIAGQQVSIELTTTTETTVETGGK